MYNCFLFQILKLLKNASFYCVDISANYVHRCGSNIYLIDIVHAMLNVIAINISLLGLMLALLKIIKMEQLRTLIKPIVHNITISL